MNTSNFHLSTAAVGLMFSFVASSALAVELRGSVTPHALQLNDVDSVMSRLEKQVFGMENAEAPVATRLELLEAKIFGGEQEGSLLQRVTKLSEKLFAEAAANQTKEDAKKTTNKTSQPLIKGAVHQFDLAQFGIDTVDDIRPGAPKRLLIKYVVPLSAAEIWGMERGDEIVRIQTNQLSTVITISRNGKIYSADLAARRETLFSGPKLPSDPAPAANSPAKPTVTVKHYNGHLGNGFNITQEITSPVTTEFVVTPSGIASGKYHQSGYDGVLVEGQALSPHEYCFRWQDMYGDGALLITFNDDMSSFTGYWAPWHRSSGMNSATDPYGIAAQIKESGLRWDGRLSD